MGSRHHSLDYSEVKDVTQIVQDFQEHNAVVVRCGFYVETVGKAPGIVMTAEAWGEFLGEKEALLLASVSVKCLDMNLRHWGAAVTHLMYVLDAKLALLEMQGPEQNS